MTFDRARFLLASVTGHLSAALEALFFYNLEEYELRIRRADMAAKMYLSVLAIRVDRTAQANIFGTINDAMAARHPLRRAMIVQGDCQ